MYFLKLLQTALLEKFMPAPFHRIPEPSLVMTDADQVSSFNYIGQEGGFLEGVYHWNILGLSRRVPYGGTLVDLGCGPGQFIYHLKKYRPDIKVYGIDLSPGMLDMAGKNLAAFDDIYLRQADMVAFHEILDQPIHAVSSIFSLHHLPSQSLEKCLENILSCHREEGASIWIFDHARPRNICSAYIFPEFALKNAPETVKVDSKNSLMASFSFEDISTILDSSVDPGYFIHRQSRFIPFYQVHASPPRDGAIFLDSRNARFKEFSIIMRTPL